MSTHEIAARVKRRGYAVEIKWMSEGERPTSLDDFEKSKKFYTEKAADAYYSYLRRRGFKPVYIRL